MFCGAEHTEGLTTDVDLLAVGLVDNVVDELEVVGVGDDLVIGENILGASVSELWPVEDFAAACRTCWHPPHRAGQARSRIAA